LWSISQIYNCPATDYIDYSNKSFLAIFEYWEKNWKIFTNLPPHWSLSARFDLVMINDEGTYDNHADVILDDYLKKYY